MKTFKFFLLLFLATSVIGWSQSACNPSVATGTPNCSAASTGFTPINDLGTGTFTNAWSVSWTGGLYPGGSNYIPSAHKTAGLAQAALIQPLDNAGNPNINGRIVLLSIGLSNTNIEFCEFDSLAALDPCVNSDVVLVNGAQGGMPVQYISTASYPQYTTYWNNVNSYLTNSGVTANQVQAVWFKDLNPAGLTPIQSYYDSLVAQFKRVMKELVTRYPNIKQCFFSSRISARYRDPSNNLNPEPYAYYQGWACKEVIEEQISGNLSFTGPGRVAPWIAWGPYLWTDGSTPQSTNPNFSLTCPADFALDGTHPSIVGARKVGNQLLCFFKNDSTSYTWFTTTGNPCTSCLFPNGTNEMAGIEQMKVYPSPSTNGNIFIELPHGCSGKTNIEIYGPLGKKVFSQKLISEKTEIDLSTQAKGIYFVQLMAGDKMYVKKLIFQ